MKALHLSDEEIQEYVLNSSASDIAIMEHAGSCEECKTRVADYQFLFSAIKQQPKPAFDFGLAGLVIAQLPPHRHTASPGNSFIYLFVAAAIALTGAALYYFRTYIASLFGSITPLLIYLTATTVITIAIILSMDMYKNYQKKMRALDFY